MNVRFSLFLTLLLAPAGPAFSSHFPNSSSLKEKYFTQDWSQEPSDAPVSVKADEKPKPSPDQPGTSHAQIGHMYMAVKAYETYISQFPGSELSKYIGGFSKDKPLTEDNNTVVHGAYAEDTPYDNPWNELFPMTRHFWHWQDGYYSGMTGFDSNINRVYKFFSGGYGIEGRYDKGWSENDGKKKGVKGEGVLALYKSGDKAKAYWYLGHALHLLQDLTVPAHTHLWPHIVKNTDRYESYMKDNHTRWTQVPTDPVESFETLYDLYQQTAKITGGFDAGYGDGPWGGKNGDRDRGNRRMNGFTEAELDEQADTLMPLAFSRGAALFKFFFKQVDQEVPQVTLHCPESAPASGLTLSASATDAVSGVDKTSIRFQYRRWTGEAWSDWRQTEAFFSDAPGRYALRASAKDAADNTGFSAVRYLTLEGSIPSLVLGRPAVPSPTPNL